MSSQQIGATRRPLHKRVVGAVLGGVLGALHFVRRIYMRVFMALDFYKKAHCDFEPRPSDIFISSYPRSGTTWMQMIMYQLTTDGDMEKLRHISQHIPFFENALAFVGPGALGKMPAPRLFKTHIRYKWTPLGPAKCIYIARNGKDVLVSYYHHEMSGRGYKGSFEQFTKMFLKGKVLHGSWFKHVAEWYAHKSDPNILFLTYEEMAGDLEGTIKRIIDFCELDIPAERLPQIVERCSFAYMKRYEPKFSPMVEQELLLGIKRDEFIRKGKVGGWQEHMTPEQTAEFDSLYEETLGNIEVNLKEPKPVASARPLAHAQGGAK
ncbi:MAG TPA: sulfotransferase domain-containing protein [Pyrinomonadaceae bacterium]|nr:sulfotransferase domain-containing protein [Pyrinomonadaceae bacterium]